MKGRERAELKDSIVKFVIEADKGTYMLNGLYERMEKPTENIDSFITILDEMAAEKPKCFEVISRIVRDKNIVTHKKMFFKVTPLAKDLTQDKSFVAEYDAMSEVIKNKKKAALRDDKIKELQLENLELGNRLSRQKIKTHWIPIGISGIGALIAIGSLVWSILSTSNNVTQDQLNPKIDSIQNRLKTLEKGLQQKDSEIDQLREELKASTVSPSNEH